MKNNTFVIDTNTLISASLFSNSTPGKAVRKANETGILSASVATYSEFAEAFLRSKFDKYISIETRLEILINFKRLAVFCEISETIIACRDPNDNKFLELAVAANASCIITGDRDLLILHPCLTNRQAFQKIPILNAADFLNNFHSS